MLMLKIIRRIRTEEDVSGNGIELQRVEVFSVSSQSSDYRGGQ